MQYSKTLPFGRPLAIALLLFLVLNACGQSQKENQASEIEKATTIDTIVKAPSKPNFKEVFEKLPLKKAPIIEKTNFDSYIDEDDIMPIDAEALGLPKIYENWYNEAYRYRALSGYRIHLSERFLTAVITCRTSEAEMESRLINYTLEGEPIDSEMVAYDEIAEGWSQVVSRISKNHVTVNRVFWDEIKKVTQISYVFAEDGTIEEIVSENLYESVQEYTLVNSILMDLKLEWAQIDLGYLMVGELSQVTTETLVIIPEIAEDDDDLLRLNSHMVLVNARTGKITHQLFETYRENGWQSDAIAIETIEMDPLVYRVNEHEKAFGIIVKYKNSSQPNPYAEEVLSLYTKEKNTLKKILNHYTIYESTGMVNVNSCYAEYTKTRNTLSFDTLKTNGYFNILFENTSIQELFQEDENGECNPTVTLLSNQHKILAYNGKVYEELPPTNQGRNRQNTDRAVQYLEYYPRKIQNLQITKFTVEQAYQLDLVKIVSGYYNPVGGKQMAPDTENDWGDRLLLLDQNNTLLYRSKGIGDVYLYEPHFYKNDALDKVIIICQKWFEYPFGGDVFILENKTIKYIGTLDIEGYSPEQNEDKVVTKIIEIKENGSRMEFTFKTDKLILDPGTHDIIIENNDVKYIYENNQFFLQRQ